ncbi:large exoprotein [Microbacterium sp. MC2]
MGGQVLGGGVIALVAVGLWLIYLLPSWHGRHQYDAAERNALRLNRALRVLAETSETPEEVRLELNARTAAAQQKLAKRAQTEREQAELDVARAQLRAARAEAAVASERARAESAVSRERARAEALAARERAKAEAVAAREQAKAESAATRAQIAAARERARREAAAALAEPALRRAQARRRVRLATTVLAVAAVALTGWGIAQVIAGAGQLLLWAGVALLTACALVLRQMAAVQRRAVARVAPVEVGRTVASAPGRIMDPETPSWTPRELPRPLTASAGSRAAAVLDGAAARDAVRRAAVDDAIRERAAQAAPPSIDTARRARPAAETFTGPADDAQIEAHVRSLLERRAAGQ